MLIKSKWIECFCLFVEKGYITKFYDNTVFLYGAEQGIVLKVQYSLIEKKIKAGIYQFSAGEFSDEKILESLEDLQFDLEDASTIYLVNLDDSENEENSINELITKLLADNSYRFFNHSFCSLVSEKCNGLIEKYKLQIKNTIFGSMAESVYLWSESFGIEISRDYYDWQISCTFFKYKINNNYVEVNKIIAPWGIVESFPKEAATVESLCDWEQDNYLVNLAQLLSSNDVDLNELVVSENLNWIEVEEPSFQM